MKIRVRRLKFIIITFSCTFLASWLTITCTQIVKAHGLKIGTFDSTKIAIIKSTQTSTSNPNINNNLLVAQLNIDDVCNRPGVDNLCNVPELGRNCQTHTQWQLGVYDYGDLCSARICGNPTPTPTTLISAVGEHPSDARNNREYNIDVRGFHQTDDGADFTGYPGPPPDLQAVNLQNLWRLIGKPDNPFATQYNVNFLPDEIPPRDWPPMLSGLNFPQCGDVTLPSTSENPRLISPGLQAMVLYAGRTTVTLQYTADDTPHVAEHGGYTVYVTGIEVNPGIIQAYQEANYRGREQLPALAPNAIIGKAQSSEIRVAIRDSAQFMDTRSQQDWWQDW